MKTTVNLGLKKPEGTDVVNIDDFNANADVLDAEIVKSASTTSDGRMSKEDKIKLNAATSAAIASTLMTRDASGRAKVAVPSASDDIARKDTVDAVQTNINGHINDKNNPHNVTITQIGAESPAGAQSKVDTHVNSVNPHPQYQSQLDSIQSQLNRNFHDDYMLWLELYYLGYVSNLSLNGVKGMHVVPFDGTDRAKADTEHSIPESINNYSSVNITGGYNFPYLGSTNAYIEFKVYGDRIIVAFNTVGSGIAAVTIDGVSQVNVDTHLSSNTYTVYTVNEGLHTVRISYTGTKNGSSSASTTIYPQGVIGYYNNTTNISNTIEKNYTLYANPANGNLCNFLINRYSGLSYGSAESDALAGLTLIRENSPSSNILTGLQSGSGNIFDSSNTFGTNSRYFKFQFFFESPLNVNKINFDGVLNSGSSNNSYLLTGGLVSVQTTTDFINWTTVYTGSTTNICNNEYGKSVNFDIAINQTIRGVRLTTYGRQMSNYSYSSNVQVQNIKVYSNGILAGKHYVSKTTTLTSNITSATVYISCGSNWTNTGLKVSNDGGTTWVTPTLVSSRTDPRFTNYTEYELNIGFSAANNKLAYKFDFSALAAGDSSVKRLCIHFK